MISASRVTTPSIESALAGLRAAREFEPHPLRATSDEVVRYVTQLQQVDENLAALISSGEVAGDELALLKGKRAQVDAAVRRQALLVGRRGASDRLGTFDTLI
jgi:hypothetical protein